MRKPRIDVIVEHVVSVIDIDAPPTSILVLLSQAYEAKGVADPVEAREYAEESRTVALTRLERMAEQRQADGRSSPWDFNPSDPSHLQGSCYVMELLDDAETVAAKDRLRQTWTSTSVIAGLHPLDFERLCILVLQALGATDIFLTPRRADQGIDFFGKLPVRSQLADIAGYPPVLDMLTVWLIGQAKQFSTSQVATFDLRELVGSIELARSKAYGLAGDRYPDLDLKVADPVIALFFTSGQVSREARILARRSGVLMVDGEALAHLLAHAQIGFDDDGNFDPVLFRDLVQAVDTRGDVDDAEA